MTGNMTRTRRTVTKAAADNRERRNAMEALANDFKGWRPRREVLKKIEAVPTCFPQVDEALGVHGFPIGRMVLVHGPSNHGKSEFALGLGRSFLEKDHFFGFIDAERTTPEPWLYELMGELADHPGFTALPTSSYEKVRAGVREYCERIAGAREKGRIPEDMTGLIVLDSIRKLIPDKLWANLTKEAEATKKNQKGVDGYGGRAGQMKAALNAAWVDELTPLLAESRMAMIVISRETEDGDAAMFADEDYKVGGGAALVYDASARLRIVRASTLYDADKNMIGERHRVDVRKTKLSRKTDRIPSGYFHTSNGVFTPVGFDRPRDVLDHALELGVAVMAGSHVKYDGRTLGQGKDKAVLKLHNEPALMIEIEAKCRSEFRDPSELVH